MEVFRASGEIWFYRDSANAVPTLINCVPELPTFGVIAGVNPTEVQWKGLFLGEPPCWSRYLLYQVSMICLKLCQNLYPWIDYLVLVSRNDSKQLLNTICMFINFIKYKLSWRWRFNHNPSVNFHFSSFLTLFIFHDFLMISYENTGDVLYISNNTKL